MVSHTNEFSFVPDRCDNQVLNSRRDPGSNSTPSASSVTRVVHDEGAIEFIELQARWHLVTSFADDRGVSLLKIFRPQPEHGVELRVSRRLHKREAVDAFMQALVEPLTAHSRPVGVEEVVFLQEVMGAWLGNNQYTNKNPLRSRCSPAVHLSQVNIEASAAQRVLCADGIVVDRDGKASQRFRDYLALVQAEDGIMLELLLLTPMPHFEPFATQLRAAMLMAGWR